MREWIPVPGTTKARLLEAAVTEFAARGFDAVGVTEVATAAGVTVGSLYHHFGSKPALYALVRTDIERRLLDRMEGARAGDADLATTLGVGFDYLVRAGFARLLSEPREGYPVEGFIATHSDLPMRGVLLAAAWRAALLQEDTAAARAALLALA